MEQEAVSLDAMAEELLVASGKTYTPEERALKIQALKDALKNSNPKLLAFSVEYYKKNPASLSSTDPDSNYMIALEHAKKENMPNPEQLINTIKREDGLKATLKLLEDLSLTIQQSLPKKSDQEKAPHIDELD
jgi:hypothetical protein